jgi:hypothetical protein
MIPYKGSQNPEKKPKEKISKKLLTRVKIFAIVLCGILQEAVHKCDSKF